ncbi:hypothetical protein BC835DRAFT_145771 [Cytidiella melzeri]|nr:hypothetical protein BC835DRAFT_145771 [Cytidiella melzeri]
MALPFGGWNNAGVLGAPSLPIRGCPSTSEFAAVQRVVASRPRVVCRDNIQARSQGTRSSLNDCQWTIKLKMCVEIVRAEPAIFGHPPETSRRFLTATMMMFLNELEPTWRCILGLACTFFARVVVVHGTPQAIKLPYLDLKRRVAVTMQALQLHTPLFCTADETYTHLK